MLDLSDTILIFSNCSMMTGCHQLDSLLARSYLHESLKKIIRHFQVKLVFCQTRSLEYSMTLRLLIEHHLEFLSLKGGCTGSPEFTLVKMTIVGNLSQLNYVALRIQETRARLYCNQLWSRLFMVCKCIHVIAKYNVTCLCLTSHQHLGDIWRRKESNLLPRLNRASGLSTSPRRLLQSDL